MSEISRYSLKEVEIPSAPDSVFKVEVISDGCLVKTVLNLPGDHDPQITNSGSAGLGSKTNLVAGQSVMVSEAYCPAPEADEIFIRYYVNEQLILTHQKAKGEDNTHLIILKLKFC